MTKTETEERASARDVRVDQIGFVGELQKHFADDLKTAVKAKMSGDGLQHVEGDYFDGLLVDGYDVQTIDPAKFLKLYEDGKIKRAEFLSALKIANKPAAEFLSGKEIDRISTTAAGQSQLRVTRKKGVEIKLTDAVRGLGKELLAEA